jgi:uncharacterized surface protein with fasciclin (FAS1) repeats
MHDIFDTAVASGNFTKLVAAITAADLATVLKGEGPFTLFAPSDAAFGKLAGGALVLLMKDPVKLKALLNYHLVASKLPADEVMQMNGQFITTVHGADLKINTSGGTRLNGQSNIMKTDIECTNGVIHVVDTLLKPPV